MGCFWKSHQWSQFIARRPKILFWFLNKCATDLPFNGEGENLTFTPDLCPELVTLTDIITYNSHLRIRCWGCFNEEGSKDLPRTLKLSYGATVWSPSGLTLCCKFFWAILFHRRKVWGAFSTPIPVHSLWDPWPMWRTAFKYLQCDFRCTTREINQPFVNTEQRSSSVICFPDSKHK